MQFIEDLNEWMKGKTVKDVNTEACNCTFFIFEDGAILCLEAEHVGQGIYGPIPYLMTQEEYEGRGTTLLRA